MKNIYLYIGGAIVVLVVVSLVVWYLFSPGTPGAANQNTTFGPLNNTTSNAGVSTPADGGTTDAQSAVQTLSPQKVFKISNGPVAGATFVQTFGPTTTLARFIMADNGHAFDLPLDIAGAVPRALSNTTIPGALSAAWASGGAVLQYLDHSTPKTLYLGLRAAGATSTLPARLMFYPDGITSLAVSPDGTKVAYELRTAGGIDGYVSKPDGTGSAKLFSLPLSQMQLRWPAASSLLAYSNAAAGVPGIAFGIDAKTGAATPLVYAPGLTATADLPFTHVLYQTSDGTARASYIHDAKTSADRPVSFDPLPEKCVQSPTSASVLYCATPTSYVPPDYLDSWHQGTAGAADSILSYSLAAATSTLLATPGSADGGVGTDMVGLAISPDGHYALFLSKFDRSLWGARLTQ